MFQNFISTGQDNRAVGYAFQHILCVEGEGEITIPGGRYPFVRGESYFLPAALGNYQVRGACRVLLSRV